MAPTAEELNQAGVAQPNTKLNDVPSQQAGGAKVPIEPLEKRLAQVEKNLAELAASPRDNKKKGRLLLKTPKVLPVCSIMTLNMS